MLNGYIYTSAIFAFLFIILGLLVFLRNTQQLINRLFLLFAFAAACWLVTNYLGGSLDIPYNVALTANRLVLGFGGVAVVSLLAFILKFTNTKIPRIGYLYGLSGVIDLLCVSSLVVANISRQQTTYSLQFGPLALVYFALLFIDFGLLIAVIIRSFHRSKGILRDQLSIILSSFVVSLGGIMIANALLPSAFDYYGATNFGSLFSAVLVMGIAYTIVRHKLFDVRLVVARSLAYLLAVGVLGVGYSLLSFTIVSYIVSNNGRAFNIAVNTVLIVLAATTFTPLKKFFDKISNRFFYRDAYDSQLFLDRFNKILVSTYDLTILLKKSAAIIAETLKPSYVVFGIKETDASEHRIVGSGGHPLFSKTDIAAVWRIAPRLGQKLIVADLLSDDYAVLRQILQQNNIAVIARLATNNKDEGVGYLALGSKKSGNLYSSQDLKVIEIISNELVIAIQNSLRFEEIENFNLTLQAKVDEATRKLRSANEKLKVLDETKDDFISMASHQLRTPLTSIKGYISMVLEGDAGKISQQQEQMLGQAFFSSQRMVYLIADLLNLSRLKTGKFIIDSAPVNLGDVVEQEMVQLKETAASRGHSLDYVKPKYFPTLMFDETKIRQVIMNFTDNAIYYTPNGGHIVVRLIDHPTTVELRVEDNGIGVPKSERPHLFSKFYRAGNARKARPDGTGLGLFMAKKVIIAQGGSLVFESIEGKGSTFGFSFVKSRLAVPEHLPAIEPQLTPVAAAK